MNRKKKINKIYSQKAKQNKRKNQPSSKSGYISKADRVTVQAEVENSIEGDENLTP